MFLALDSRSCRSPPDSSRPNVHLERKQRLNSDRRLSLSTFDFSSPGIWRDKEEAWQEPIPKVHRRVLANSLAATLALFRLEAGAVIAKHSHPHAQHGVCLEGAGEFTMGDKIWKIKEGDSWFIPPGVPHEFRNSPDTSTLIIEVFTPRREEYPPDSP